MAVRAARREDLPALARLNAEVHALHIAHNPRRYRDPPLAEIETWFREQLAQEHVAILVSEDDDALVGYVIVRRIDAAGHAFAAPRRTAYVDQLGVTASAKRRGHGRALMAATEAHARDWGAVEIALDVQSFNADARRFYQAIGYDVVSSRLGRSLDPR